MLKETYYIKRIVCKHYKNDIQSAKIFFLYVILKFDIMLMKYEILKCEKNEKIVQIF